jgi:pimeloyl-ACP methyl ester carboxylesterase
MMTLAAHYPFLSARAKARFLDFNDQQAKGWPVPCECRTVDTSWGQTFMRVSGPADAPPLVLLHGGGKNSLMWIPNIKALSERYRTYALDTILDVGRSWNNQPIKTVDDLTDWLDELFDVVMPGSEVRLLGLSHGGWLAANYAHRHPARVSKLALLAPVGWILPISPATLLHLVQTLFYPRRFFIRRAYRYSCPDLAASGPRGRQIIEEMTEELAMA